MVALVDDDLAVGTQLVGKIGPAGQGLQGGDIDDAGQFGAATAELPWFGAEQVVDLATPLVGEGLPVHQYERGNGSFGNDRAGHHGLAGAGWGHEKPQLVGDQGLHCIALLRPEIEGGREIQRISADSLIVHLDLAAGLLDESRRRVVQAAWQDEVIVERFVVGGNDAWNVPCRLAATLAVVELWVVRGRRVLQRRIERGAQLRARNSHGTVNGQMHDRSRIRLGLGRPGGLGAVDSCPDLPR